MINRMKGLTLSELLVVILIVLVLIGLLMPALTGALRRAEGTVCTSNVHQIFLAMKLYQDDHGDYPPNSVTWPAFQPYYRTVLTCPASKFKTTPNLRRLDYTLVGSVIPKVGPGYSPEGSLEAFQSCRATRGTVMPVVIDQNHVKPNTSTKDSTSRYIICREGGDVHSVHSNSLGMHEICSDLISILYNL